MDKFNYNGFTFEPIRQFNEKENAMDFGQFIKKLTDHDWQNEAQFCRNRWNYDDFYKAAKNVGGGEMDIFLCLENRKLYVPSAPELYIFTGTLD